MKDRRDSRTSARCESEFAIKRERLRQAFFLKKGYGSLAEASAKRLYELELHYAKQRIKEGTPESIFEIEGDPSEKSI